MGQFKEVGRFIISPGGVVNKGVRSKE